MDDEKLNNTLKDLLKFIKKGFSKLYGEKRDIFLKISIFQITLASGFTPAFK